MFCMPFDPQTLFANLAEKEKLKGHHSPEGRAIRIVTRAMSGWSSGNLSNVDVLVLCDQAMEDWLKARLNVPAWSARGLPDLLERAVEKELIVPQEAVRLQKVLQLREPLPDSGTVSAAAVESALDCCIQVLDKHW
jgi:hypothetical protein